MKSIVVTLQVLTLFFISLSADAKTTQQFQNGELVFYSSVYHRSKVIMVSDDYAASVACPVLANTGSLVVGPRTSFNPDGAFMSPQMIYIQLTEGMTGLLCAKDAKRRMLGIKLSNPMSFKMVNGYIVEVN